MKKISYEKKFTKSYFWRTRQQREIDDIAEQDGHIKGFDFKRQGPSKQKKIATFTDTDQTSIQVIN